MKKLLFLFSALLFVSCSGDTESINCDCGIIEERDSELDFEPMEWTYYADIRNVCTNEIENDIQITQNIFVNYYPGDEICNIDSIRLN